MHPANRKIKAGTAWNDLLVPHSLNQHINCDFRYSQTNKKAQNAIANRDDLLFIGLTLFTEITTDEENHGKQISKLGF
jgi:hypothetical protein